LPGDVFAGIREDFFVERRMRPALCLPTDKMARR